MSVYTIMCHNYIVSTSNQPIQFVSWHTFTCVHAGFLSCIRGTMYIVHRADMGSITCKCNRLQLQLLWDFMITDYNYFFLYVIDYNYRLHCKVIIITL